MTRDEFRLVFGNSFSPQDICELQVLAGKNPPRTPEQWQALAQEVMKARERAEKWLGKSEAN